MENEKQPDRTLEAFKRLVRHARGALWWVRNDFLKAHQPQFNQRDTHIGHPALSVLSTPLEERGNEVPMLTGTSGDSLSGKRRAACVMVTGMTANDPQHLTYFGSIVEPATYTAEDLLDAVNRKPDIHDGKHGLYRDAWHVHRTMNPNWDKPTVDERERADLDRFCELHHL